MVYLDPGKAARTLNRADAEAFALQHVELWDAECREALVCRGVWNETPDVKTFVFAPARPRLFQFLPGQFMTWEFEIEGRPVRRCYTIASSAARPHAISITVKRQPGGHVSSWLHDNLRPEMAVHARGPTGAFTCVGDYRGKYLFLSGGSGITPLMSMARSHDDIASAADIIFAHNARTPVDIIFREELAALARHRRGFRFMPICEADSPCEAWHGLRGRLDPRLLALIAPDLMEREIFTCGPAPYMAAVREMLRATQFDMAHYHEESFCFETLLTEPAGLQTAAAEEGFHVSFRQSGRSIVCASGESILNAALAAGMQLPFSCSQGVCGTCKSRMVSGSVDMRHQGGILPREIEQGMILLCCSRPTSDVVVDR